MLPDTVILCPKCNLVKTKTVDMKTLECKNCPIEIVVEAVGPQYDYYSAYILGQRYQAEVNYGNTPEEALGKFMMNYINKDVKVRIIDRIYNIK